MAAKGVSIEPLLETALAKKPDDGRPAFDMFRDRLMFPICDGQGNPVAFGGRILGDGEPKYLNSPETSLFHKGRLLYGAHLARKSAYDHGEVIVAEGYMDVIALAEGGFTQSVAPLGTAVTEDHLAQLFKFASEPILCFDGDNAGQRAMARAAERALPGLKPGNALRFAILPKGDDPDTLIRNRGRPRCVRSLIAARLWLTSCGAPPVRACALTALSNEPVYGTNCATSWQLSKIRW